MLVLELTQKVKSDSLREDGDLCRDVISVMSRQGAELEIHTVFSICCLLSHRNTLKIYENK